MPFDSADLSAFIDSDMPGYRLAKIGEKQIGGLFRKPYSESFGIVGGDNPAFRGLSSDLSEVSPGDYLDIDDIVYRVAKVKPDGAGMILLELI